MSNEVEAFLHRGRVMRSATRRNHIWLFRLYDIRQDLQTLLICKRQMRLSLRCNMTSPLIKFRTNEVLYLGIIADNCDHLN